jgi:ABC-type multidrug transport system fused ATPase/permease subunit
MWCEILPRIYGMYSISPVVATTVWFLKVTALEARDPHHDKSVGADRKVSGSGPLTRAAYREAIDAGWCVQVVTRGKHDTKVRTLLNNVSAAVNHSQVLAIAGPSGSSKTTFLDALAGRIDPKSLKGQILVNGKPMDSAFKRISGYVMQVWNPGLPPCL